MLAGVAELVDAGDSDGSIGGETTYGMVSNSANGLFMCDPTPSEAYEVSTMWIWDIIK